MAKLSKRMKALGAKVQTGKHYPLDEALNLIKQTASAKFDESVDVAVNLGIDAKKSEQNVRAIRVNCNSIAVNRPLAFLERLF